MHAHTHTHMRTCMCACTHTCAHTHTIHIHTHTHTRTHAHTHAHTRTHACALTQTHIRSQTPTDTHTQTLTGFDKASFCASANSLVLSSFHSALGGEGAEKYSMSVHNSTQWLVFTSYRKNVRFICSCIPHALVLQLSHADMLSML